MGIKWDMSLFRNMRDSHWTTLLTSLPSMLTFSHTCLMAKRSPRYPRPGSETYVPPSSEIHSPNGFHFKWRKGTRSSWWKEVSPLRWTRRLQRPSTPPQRLAVSIHHFFRLMNMPYYSPARLWCPSAKEGLKTAPHQGRDHAARAGQASWRKRYPNKTCTDWWAGS